MARYRKLTTICAAIVLPFGLAACGGGGDSADVTPPPPTPTGTVMLPDGHGLNPGTTMLAAGQVLTVGDTTIACPGASACTLTVSKDPVTGAYSATWTGGAVTVAVAEPPPPPPGPDPVKLAEARDGARDAWRAARAALAGIAGKQSANMAAYQLAMDAVDDAKDAYDAALAAETVAEAERQKENADAANETAQSQVAAVIASYEAPDLKKAQMAAKSASDAAKKAYDDAKGELDKVEKFKGVDMDSYNTAKTKVDAAKDASDAAKAASDAAAGTSVLADAQASQKTAEDQLANANTAKDDATEYAGMVQTAENEALSTAKADAKTAYDAAKKAYDDAKKRVDDLTATDVADYVRASDALKPVKAALDAAESANDMAQAATASADAKEHQAAVEKQRDAAVTEKADVDMYAALVEAVQNDRADEEQRKKDVATARGDAMQSYMDADADATKAEKEADAAEKTAPGTPGAIAARNAAKAARTAADNAKDAHDAITDDMTKAEADAKAADAATQAGNANSGYMTAKKENDDIQTAHTIGEEQRRVQAIADARDYGGTAVANAKKAADDAQDAADAAKKASDDAQDAHTAAVNARTDATEAKKQADAAKTAHTAAQAAADDAMDAYKAAKAAIDGVTDDSTEKEAKDARMTAETQAGVAATSKTTAMTGQTDAEAALVKAVAAAGAYTGDSVVGLLAAANDADETNAKDRAARIKIVAGHIEAAAKQTGDDRANSAGDNRNDSRSSGEASATVAWPADTPDDPDTTANEFVAGLPSVTISNIGEPNVTSETRASKDNSDPPDGDFTDTGDILNNADKIAGLPGFSHGFDITQGDRHMIVFTDKKQATAKVDAKTVTLANVPVTASRIVESEYVGEHAPNYDASSRVKLATTNIDTVDELDSNTRYDHDGNPATLPVLGDYSCVAATGTCTVQVSGTNVVGISLTGDARVLFTSSPTADSDSDGSPDNLQGIVTAATAADSMNDYLVFGVWMDEDNNDTGEGTTPDIGAFANVGTTFATPATLVGKATYNGAAAGVYTEGTKVDYFQGSATLKADFGAIDTAAERATDPAADTTLGTVSGTIDNIVAGGKSMSDVISLNAGAIQADGNIYNGNARMGTATVKDSAATYPYNGTWSGQFGGKAAASDAKGVDLLPPAVAGTFGVTGSDKMGTPDDTKDDVIRSYVGAFGARR